MSSDEARLPSGIEVDPGSVPDVAGNGSRRFVDSTQEPTELVSLATVD